MKKIIKFTSLFLMIFCNTELRANQYEKQYEYIYQDGKNFVRIDKYSILKVDEYKFASGIYSSQQSVSAYDINYLADCKNKNIIEDIAKFQNKNQLNSGNHFHFHQISLKPNWKEVKGEKLKKVFKYICNF